jgi:hypothetical protein
VGEGKGRQGRGDTPGSLSSSRVQSETAWYILYIAIFYINNKFEIENRLKTLMSLLFLGSSLY